MLNFYIYRFAVCYVIIDPSSGKAHNIVAAINVGPSYHAKIASPVSNDNNNKNNNNDNSNSLNVNLLNIDLKISSFPTCCVC
jgi:hypothetical protein